MYVPHVLFYLYCKKWCLSIQEGKRAQLFAFSFLVVVLGRVVLTISIIIITFIFIIPFTLGSLI